MKHHDLIVKARQGGEELRQVYSLAVTDVAADSVVQDAAEQLAGWFATIWRPAHATAATVYEVASRSVDVAGMPEIPRWQGSITGNAQGEPLPRVLCGMLNLTSITARPNRGRKYFFGTMENHNVAPGEPSQDYKNVLVAFGQAILSYNNGFVDSQFVIARRAKDGTVTESNIITQVSASGRWGYQRRRDNGR